MQKKKYNTKWAITYKGKSYITIYGKKKAYDMYVKLSASVDGLEIVQAEKREKTAKSREEKQKYCRSWREKNKDKVKEYNRKYYLKRKESKNSN
ncbi:hypothetical protein [Paenibacillus alkalitolerans]|uniref:hypothetical protein n=1 Tax=Paenibacillus alkalitolerans TaxID=2799335 RepID=UPI001F3B0225|nr:hypothetical protein [Paenibacillus alkalitolerans]